jgi:4-oxalocrotonate tautomerase
MPVIRIELAPGRSREQKKETAVAITDAVSRICKCAPEAVHVVFIEVSNSHWAVGGRFLDEPKPS